MHEKVCVGSAFKKWSLCVPKESGGESSVLVWRSKEEGKL